MVELDQGGRLAGRASVEPVRGVLGALAEHSFILRTENEHAESWRIVPDLSAHFIVHFSGTPDRPTAPRARVSGTRSVHCNTPMRRRQFSVGIRLAPGALATLTRLPATEFVDTSVPLADLWPRETTRLMDRIDDAPSAEAVRQTLLTFLGEIAGDTSDPDWRVRGYTRSIRTAPRQRLYDIAEALGMGTRTLRRTCVEKVGLGPKRMARIIRIYRAIRAATTQPGQTDGMISNAAGFTDQAHMIREFHALLGETPRQFCSRRISA